MDQLFTEIAYDDVAKGIQMLSWPVMKNFQTVVLKGASSLQLDGVPMSDSMNWTRGIPKLDNLEGLYLEFVRLDASALRRMRRLQELRMFFDEWDTSNIAAFASMPELQTLYLEPAVEEILQPSMLLGLGQNIRQVYMPDIPTARNAAALAQSHCSSLLMVPSIIGVGPSTSCQ